LDLRGIRIAQIDRLAASAPKAQVAVIQGNIEQSQKWDPAFQVAAIENMSDCRCPRGRSIPT
jgi:apolipoprotein N-acyltransferase